MAAEAFAWGFSLFCDDFRQEIGGKYSIMGVYQSDIIFPQSLSFPLIVPKFVIVVKYYEVKGKYADDLLLKVFMPWDSPSSPTLIQEFKRSDLDAAVVRHPPSDDFEVLYTITYPLIFSPLELRGEGWISVRMQRGDEITKLGRLMIRKATTEENAIFAAFSAASSPLS